MVKQNTGELVCVAEDEDRFTLGEAKEEMLIALGLADEDGSTMKFLRARYKTNTWWEEDSERSSSTRGARRRASRPIRQRGLARRRL